MSISPHPIRTLRRALNYVLWSGVAISAMDILVIGPTLIAYAAFFGAGNIAFGILSAIPYFGNLTHLLAAYWIEKGYSVRKISVYSSLFSRPFYLLAAGLAFYTESPYALTLLIIFLSVGYLSGSLSGGAWQPWMKSIVPQQIMGRFFAQRFKFMMFVKSACFLGASYLLEKTDNNLFSYAGLLAAAFVFGIFSTIILSAVHDIPISTVNTLSFHRKILIALKNPPFLHLILCLSFLTFIQVFTLPFITVYMLKTLRIDMSIILLLNLLMQIFYIFSSRYWGKIADNKDIFIILKQSVILFAVSILGLIFTTFFTMPAHQTILYIALIHVVLGISVAGIALGINNTSLMYVPQKMSAVYLSINSVGKSFAGGAAALSAGLWLNVFNNWSVFFITSLVLCVLTFPTIKSMSDTVRS